MVVTVTATTTAGKALSGELLQKVEAGCDMALQLDEDKQQVSCGCNMFIQCCIRVFLVRPTGGTSWTATTTAGKALSGELLQKDEAGCDMALQLDEDKQQVRPWPQHIVCYSLLQLLCCLLHAISPSCSWVFMYGAGKALSGELPHKIEAGCDMALQVDEDEQQVRRCGCMPYVLLFCQM
jgi:hypothetical protein